MGMHTELPIYKVAYDLLSLATDITRNIQRGLKIGARVKAEQPKARGKRKAPSTE